MSLSAADGNHSAVRWNSSKLGKVVSDGEASSSPFGSLFDSDARDGASRDSGVLPRRLGSKQFGRTYTLVKEGKQAGDSD